jgi:hypothetical protein
VIFIVALLGERDGGVLIPHLHTQRVTPGADRQLPIAELTCDVERLARRLLARQTQRILGHLRLDARAHHGARPEEPVGRRESLKRLMRPLKVVVLDKKAHAPLAVLEVGEHRAREQFLPQGLPEPLDFPAGLRMVRPALHVLDTMTLKLRLELRAAAPGGVLPPLIRQYLPRRSVLGDAARQRLQHQHTTLVMRHGQAYEIPRVIIQERRYVDPLVLAQQEREQVRLPQLVRLRSLEVLDNLLTPHTAWCHLCLDAFGLENPPHRRCGSADPQEPPHQVPDTPAAPMRLLALRCEDRCGQRIALLRKVLARQRPLALERFDSTLPAHLHPLHRSRVGHPQPMRHFVRVQALLDDRTNHRLAHLR